MSEKINQAVTKMRNVSRELKAVCCTCDELEAQLVGARKSRESLQEELRMVDRELKGAIYDETQT